MRSVTHFYFQRLTRLFCNIDFNAAFRHSPTYLLPESLLLKESCGLHPPDYATCPRQSGYIIFILLSLLRRSSPRNSKSTVRFSANLDDEWVFTGIRPKVNAKYLFLCMCLYFILIYTRKLKKYIYFFFVELKRNLLIDRVFIAYGIVGIQMSFEWLNGLSSGLSFYLSAQYTFYFCEFLFLFCLNKSRGKNSLFFFTI